MLLARLPPAEAVDVRAMLDAHLAALRPDRLGHGPDEYADRPCEHPMAYALYLRGLVSLQAATGDPRYAALAAGAVERLEATATAGGRAWGLGFERAGAPATAPFTVTTALVAWGLADHAELTSDPRSVDLLARACRWLVHDVPWRLEGAGAGPWYAPHQPHVLPNVAAITAGALARAAAVTADERLLRPAREAAALVLAAQRPDGLWGYGYAGTALSGHVRPPNVVDALHTAYVIDGVITGPARAKTRAAVARGLDAFASLLVGPGGRLAEKGVLVDPDDAATAELLANPRLRRRGISGDHVLVEFPAESRLWGYGATVALATRALRAGIPQARQLQPVIDRVLARHLSARPGRFGYLPGDPRAFPRHEAHLFAGVASVLAGAGG